MSQDSGSTERARNLWAPWRMEYIDSLSEDEGGCFLCRYVEQPQADQENLVLWRGRHCLAVLNRFPYTGGHTMIAPLAHVANMDDLAADAMVEIMQYLRDVQRIITHAIRSDGFNIGINIGRCAGAGLPGHLHIHIVPRWNGDTNFMAVFGGVRVIPESLEKLYQQLRKAGAEIGLPKEHQ